MIGERFPNLLKQNEIVHFYEVKDPGKMYFCNEVEEVGFYITNDYGNEENIKWIQEFIKKYILTHDHLTYEKNKDKVNSPILGTLN